MKDYVKYIKVADAVKILFGDCIRYVFPTTAEPTTEFIKLDNAINLLQLYPSEDVEPVVRCKECKWYVRSMIKQDGTLDERYKPDWCDLYRRVREETYFCADGERKDDDKSCDTCKYYDKGWDDIICDGCTKAHSNWERRDDE